MLDHLAVEHFIKGAGATHCQFIISGLPAPEERIRRYCLDNRCGRYGRHLMCPPHTGSLAESAEKLKRFDTGILIQYTKALDVRKDRIGLSASKRALHDIILETEGFLRERASAARIWGTIGGDCELCDECAGFRGEACLFPDRARPSLEALGIDVIGLLNSLSLDCGFYNDRVTWTGVVLIETR